MRVESGGYGRRKRGVRKSEELKQRSYRGIGWNGWISRASERATRLKGRVVPRKKESRRETGGEVSKRIRKRRGKNRETEGNARDNEEW